MAGWVGLMQRYKLPQIVRSKYNKELLLATEDVKPEDAGAASLVRMGAGDTLAHLEAVHITKQGATNTGDTDSSESCMSLMGGGNGSPDDQVRGLANNAQLGLQEFGGGQPCESRNNVSPSAGEGKAPSTGQEVDHSQRPRVTVEVLQAADKMGQAFVVEQRQGGSSVEGSLDMLTGQHLRCCGHQVIYWQDTSYSDC